MEFKRLLTTLFWLYCAYSSGKLAYQGVVKREISSNRWVEPLLGIPHEYYQGWRAIRTGLFNIPPVLLFCYFAFLSWRGEGGRYLSQPVVTAILLYIVICVISCTVDSPWRKKS